jgi:hypothetical protein
VHAATGQLVAHLAPSDLRNPQTYKLTSADLERIKEADWIVYSGQESFAAELIEAGQDNTDLIEIQTGNTPENIRLQTAFLADYLGTSSVQSQWVTSFSGVAARIKAEVNAVFPPGTPVVAHPAQASLADWLGFEVVAELSPMLSNNQRDALDEPPEIVLDSYHEPVGDQVAEAVEALYVQFISFPGPNGTTSLADVLRYNRDLLVTYSLPPAEPSTADRMLPWLIGIGGGLIILGLGAWFLLRRLAKR